MKPWKLSPTVTLNSLAPRDNVKPSELWHHCHWLTPEILSLPGPDLTRVGSSLDPRHFWPPLLAGARRVWGPDKVGSDPARLWDTSFIVKITSLTQCPRFSHLRVSFVCPVSKSYITVESSPSGHTPRNEMGVWPAWPLWRYRANFRLTTTSWRRRIPSMTSESAVRQ